MPVHDIAPPVETTRSAFTIIGCGATRSAIESMIDGIALAVEAAFDAIAAVRALDARLRVRSWLRKHRPCQKCKHQHGP